MAEEHGSSGADLLKAIGFSADPYNDATQGAQVVKANVAKALAVDPSIIDVKSSDIQANYTSEQIEDLPVPRTYRGLFQLAPGVSENGRNTPNAGASRMDNTYLIDGINVTNPHYGDILPDVTELDIAEVLSAVGRDGAPMARYSARALASSAQPSAPRGRSMARSRPRTAPA